MLLKRGNETFHFVFKWLAFILGVFSSYVASWTEDVTLGLDLFGGSAVGKAGNVFVFASLVFAAPSVVSASDVSNFLFGKLTMRAVHKEAQFSGVDEESLFPPVPESAV